MENKEILDWELEERVYVYDGYESEPPVGIVKVNVNIAGDIDSDEDLDEDGYVLLGITRLQDGRYVEINRCLADYSISSFVISEDQALLIILQYGKEEILEEKKFADLKSKYEKLVKEMED